MDKEYGVNCSDISLEKIYNHLDVFALGHFVGWAFKAVLIRHMGILWAMSVMWEFTEVKGECGGVEELNLVTSHTIKRIKCHSHNLPRIKIRQFLLK